MIAMLGLLANVGCENAIPEFSGDNAFMYLEKQCSFGPRNPGSEGYYSCKDYLIDQLKSKADTIWVQPFSYFDPYRK